MSIGIKRVSFIVLLVIGIFEVFILSNGAVVSIGTVFGACCICGILHLLGINIWNKEKSFYMKDLRFAEKVLAAFTFALMIVWFITVVLHF